MTIAEALALVDEVKPNQWSEERKIGWLNELDGRVNAEVIATHERDANTPQYQPYTMETDQDTVLLIPDPYSEAYRWYLEMQIDLANNELKKHNNSMTMFSLKWGDFTRMYNREHMPLQRAGTWRF